MIRMTKAAYLSMPREQRRRHKDKTYWLRMARGRTFTWVQVVFHC